MANVGSFPKEGQSVFDFDTQSGITHLLASVRASDLKGAEKNELRDLIFLYANGGRDESVKTTLEQKIATFDLQPVTKEPVKNTEEKIEKKERPAIGNFRSAPSFSLKTGQVEEVGAKPRGKETKQPQPTENEIKQKEETTEPTPQPEVKPPVSEVSPEPIAPTPKPAPEPAPAPEPEVPKEAAITSTPQAGDPLVRIKEIKAAVNEKVGNPVNLVDINNEVGREYMSALLDAMKKINTGSSAGSAMARLESAYAAVEEAVKNKDVVQKTPTPEPVTQPTPMTAQTTSVPVSTPAPQPEVKPPVSEVSPEPIAPTPKPAPKTAPAPEPEVPKEETEKAEPEPQQPQPVTEQRIPIANIPTHIPEEKEDPVPIKSSLRKEEAQTNQDDNRWAEPAASPTQPAVAQGSGLKPLASLADLSKPDVPEGHKAKEQNPDSLNTPEIDKGLDQLLEEWPIFKKSGLFGTGPKGRQHPLFIQISSLQIPLLLAGRFEGATQEIKQSITDYMNGWRYEQGLIYEQGETFEHYLRRVIKHILDLQKQR